MEEKDEKIKIKNNIKDLKDDHELYNYMFITIEMIGVLCSRIIMAFRGIQLLRQPRRRTRETKIIYSSPREIIQIQNKSITYK